MASLICHKRVFWPAFSLTQYMLKPYDALHFTDFTHVLQEVIKPL